MEATEEVVLKVWKDPVELAGFVLERVRDAGKMNGVQEQILFNPGLVLEITEEELMGAVVQSFAYVRQLGPGHIAMAQFRGRPELSALAFTGNPKHDGIDVLTVLIATEDARECVKALGLAACQKKTVH